MQGVGGETPPTPQATESASLCSGTESAAVQRNKKCKTRWNRRCMKTVEKTNTWYCALIKKKKKQQQHFSVSFTSYHVVQPEKLQQRVNLSGTSEVKVHRRTSTSISDCSTASVTYLEYPEYFIKHLADVVESHSHMDVTEQSLTSLTCR